MDIGAVGDGKGKEKGKKDKGKGKGDGKGKDKSSEKSALTCSNSWCGKSGHLAKDCWKAKPAGSTGDHCPICGPERGNNHGLDKCL